ncbi:MAG: FtsX-like permease family protein, partial [Actinomycetota bacterium]
RVGARMNTAPLRATARIASRSARRNVRRSLLVVAMVALPTAGVTAAATVARTIVGTPEQEVAATMGSADALFTVGRGFDPDRLDDRLPLGSELVAMRTEDVGLVHQGELLFSTLVEPDTGLDNRVLHGMYALGSGAAPTESGETAVNQRLLDSFGAEIGDEIEVGEHRLTVTGIVEARDLDHPIAIVGPGTLAGKGGLSNLLIDLPAGASTESLSRLMDARWHQGYTMRDDVAAEAAFVATTWDAISLVGGVLALFATGLIAAAAFVVGARRQLRELGLVGAVGGEPRHVRAVVWLGGTTLGLAGGVLGSIAGVGLALAVHPLLDRLVGRVVGPLDVNPLMLVAAILMGTVAATLSALAPARAAGKLSVMAALAGRTPPPRAPGRVAAFGLIVLLIGGVVTAWATLKDEGEILSAGLVVMLVGILLWIPLLVSAVGRFANRLPMSGRLAARDAARHGRRTGAAVAAAVVALAVPVTVSAYSLSEETYERRSPRLFDNELLIGTFSEVAPDPSPQDVGAAFEEGFPDASVVPLTQAVSSRSADIQDVSVYVGVRAPGELGGETSPGIATIVAWPLFVGDASTLGAIGAEEGSGALEEGRAVVLGGYDTRNGFVRVSEGGRGGSKTKLAATTVDSPGYFNESIPKIVVSPETAARLGLHTQVSGHLLANSSALSSDEIARARDVAGRLPGVFVRSNDDYLPKYAAGRAAATAASVPLALAVLAVAVALVASESRRSHQILVAVGAGPLAHRKVVASTSALLALITAILAVPAGFLPTVVVQVASQAGRPVVVPWLTIAIVVIVTPLLSAGVAGLVVRTPKLGSLLTPAI